MPAPAAPAAAPTAQLARRPAAPDALGRILARTVTEKAAGPGPTGPKPAPTVATLATVEEIDALALEDIKAIDPKSLVPYRILHDVLHQSWHVAKELLLDPHAPNRANRRAMMQVLVDYRAWHHQAIIQEVRQELDTRFGEGALKKSGSAGSTTLTSDIDVNLKGAQTELAVALFNARFRRSTSLPGQPWDYEPGVVYDVNVYAVDFMHTFGGVATADDHVATVKEGVRAGHTHGGIGDARLAELDRREQLVTALFKARLFMTAEQWAEYKALSLRGIPSAAVEAQAEAFWVAEVRFAGYLDEMFGRIDVRLGARVDQHASGVEQLKQAAALQAPAAGDHDHVAEGRQENILMTAANRIYEDKLAVIRERRTELKALLAQYEHRDALGADPLLDAKIDRALLALRKLVAEASMYANEASMTDATVHHVVVGLQGGRQIDQQKVEGINAVQENMADVFKEAGRYGPALGPAALKAGKYMMRMADAAKNLGFGYIWGVQVLYTLGHAISEDIKKRADSGDIDAAGESAAAVTRITGRTDLPGLLALAMQTAAEVGREYAQERAAHTAHDEADTQTAYGHRTAATGASNAHLLNQGMVHPADRAAHGTVSEMEQAESSGEIGDFAFLLSESELAALRQKWASA
jgi:hypothetical protein